MKYNRVTSTEKGGGLGSVLSSTVVVSSDVEADNFRFHFRFLKKLLTASASASASTSASMLLAISGDLKPYNMGILFLS